MGAGRDDEARAGSGAVTGRARGAGRTAAVHALPEDGLPARGLAPSVLALVVLVLAGCTGPAGGASAEVSSDVPGTAATSPSPSPASPSPTSIPTTPIPTTTPTPTPPPEPTPTVPPEPPAPQFAATASPIGPELTARMAPSWRPGCPVPLEDLRHLTLTHHDFDGGVVTGELVVHADVADGVVEVFRTLFDAGYPIRSMRLVDDFGGSDDASMAADNTSAFNCRAITRGTGWSEHAYGRALDLNPRENPYVRGTLVLPPEGRPYADRPDLPGVVHAGDVVVTAFAAAGWRWGGDWTSPIDYQHFSVTGR
ncbi:M15 family metallopeptidase [Cellulomonas cellasea]|uniref:Peptidase M15C domain-containing protein n=1 Tax=Cellulomonas cellasea TaxID=43670 RepID=A0A7W4UEY5_9CELL|nr:M15 family metallopeptidase [Cellulomonas cellasea]MBB2922921.1 hypothetical protein [Cellulomonas cellasea]